MAPNRARFSPNMGWNSGFFHMLTASHMKHSDSIARIAGFHCILFVLKSCEACKAPVVESIVLLIVLLCFQVELDWFTEPPVVVQLCRSKWPHAEVCRAISSCCTRNSATYTCRILETFGWRAKEYLGALTLRNNAREAVAGRWIQSSDVFVQVQSFRVWR